MGIVKPVYLKLERLPGLRRLLVPARLRYAENCPPGLPAFKRVFVYLALFPGLGKPIHLVYSVFRGKPVPQPENPAPSPHVGDEAPAPEPAPAEPPPQDSAAQPAPYVGYNPTAPLPPHVEIDFESGAKDCQRFSQLIIEPDRRMAFEYYRSGMYVRCMAVVDNVFDHYVDVMEMDADAFAGKTYLKEMTGGPAGSRDRPGWG